MTAAELLQGILILIEEGATVESTALVPVVNDLGLTVAQGVPTLAQLGNGVATEVTSLVSYEAGAATGTSAGLGILGMEVGAVGAAIAPALGILAGVGLYNLAPNFWTKVSNKLIEAGQTIGGKVIGYLTQDGRVGYSEETVEILKQAFIDEGLFAKPDGQVDYTQDSVGLPSGFVFPFPFASGEYNIYYNREVPSAPVSNQIRIASSEGEVRSVIFYGPSIPSAPNVSTFVLIACSLQPFTYYSSTQSTLRNASTATINNLVVYTASMHGSTAMPYTSAVYNPVGVLVNEYEEIRYYGQYIFNIAYYILKYGIVGQSTALQPDATYPTETETIPQTYPDWIPIPEIPSFPTVYPVELPTPDITQIPSQNPVPATEPTGNPETLIQTITISTPIPAPNPDLYPIPEGTQDPDTPPTDVNPPTVTPDEPQPPDPPDPNEPVTPDIDPVVPPVLTTVSSNKLFTVYNPSSSQLDQLGGFLWTTDLVDMLRQIWQNPLDGIISLHQVYCIPTTGQSSNIILGTLDSGISAPIVTSQYSTISCGTLPVAEDKKNVTDYSPYASLHIYLPFIGIVELDVDEVMNGQLAVTYSVDVYTGTCLAELTVSRSPDLIVPKILYTFAGNCSQSLPLTSVDRTGLFASLATLTSTAIGASSGGGIAAYAISSAIGHSVTHELFHVNHSGGLSSNAGIMGQRKPYIIIGRRYGYDANAYNEIYGYPTNKTVNLGNCTGFTRVKAINLQSNATGAEKAEIETLLKSGVIL